MDTFIPWSKLEACITPLPQMARVEGKRGTQYPLAIKSWRSIWESLSVYFKYPEPVRKAFYTTNVVIVNSENRPRPKVENALLKLLYSGMLRTPEKWTYPVQKWKMTLTKLSIYVKGRIDGYVDL